MNFQSSSSAITKKFAAALAKALLKKPAGKRAAVFALQGELGAGKTTFAQGFLKGLGLKERTASPTFIIMREFALHDKHFHRLYHIDTYRISAKEAGVLGLKKIFRDPKNIVLIEWPENIKNLIPKSTLRFYFAHSKNKNHRVVKIKSDAF